MTKDGGPAFPLPLGQLSASDWGESGGMTMRDYFAAAAMPEAMRIIDSINLIVPPEPRSEAARIAYEVADAMLAERERGGK